MAPTDRPERSPLTELEDLALAMCEGEYIDFGLGTAVRDRRINSPLKLGRLAGALQSEA
jgi:hypothetical protein